MIPLTARRPDLRVGYSHCPVRFNTHSVAGIAINHLICAAQGDALVAEP